jgi:hypothetical protein
MPAEIVARLFLGARAIFNCEHPGTREGRRDITRMIPKFPKQTTRRMDSFRIRFLTSLCTQGGPRKGHKGRARTHAQKRIEGGPLSA